MGEVYKARDTRLERTVAVKVLPSHLSASAEVRQRFEREAKTISQLSHPHICALYDVGNQDGVEYLVMELLEGETLAERISRGPLPAEQVLRYAVEAARALDAAHRTGIVHRDLKPGNVMLTKAGVKLLDFGLAKIAAPDVRSSSLSALPTQARENLTQEGTILGTFQYMAPEQLEGREADARTDIFALGAVIYEMATGARAFAGTSRASLISSILRDEPKPISQVLPMTPPALDRVVKTCLAKDPEDRWQSARDVASELQWISETGSSAATNASPASPRRRIRGAMAVGAAAGLITASLFGFLFLRRGSDPPRVHRIHASIPVPEQADFSIVAVPEISPDGKTLVWSGSDAATGSHVQTPLWVRSLASDDAHPLAGTERAMFAFWSPDSRSIGFFADRKLKRIDLAGGSPVTLCDIPDVGRGGSWNRDGVIIFSGGRAGPLFRISAAGGLPEPLTKLDPARGDTTHRWPHFLPDGRHFLYLASRNVSGKRAVFFASLDGSVNRALALAPEVPIASSEAGHPMRTEEIANAAYAGGLILFVQRSALYARSFDPAGGQITGAARVVAENVGSGFSIIRSMFSVSQNDDLVFVASPSAINSRVEWIDREGRRSPALAEKSAYSAASLSPDGKRLAVAIEDARTRQSDVWAVDLGSAVRTRLTFGPGHSESPVWSPAARIAYWATRSGAGIFEKASSGEGPEKLLHTTSGRGIATVTSWSADGRFLLYTAWNGAGGTNYDVWVLPVSPPGEPFPFLQSPADELDACFSPDGRNVAYTSTESGSDEVYVQSFPAGAGKWQISTEGGALPRWRRDGREIFFVDLRNRILSVALGKAGSLAPSAPRVVADPASEISDYDPSPDGQRFLILSPVVDQAHLPLRLIAHWTAGLEK